MALLCFPLSVSSANCMIPGIYYVIDLGFAKQNAYDPRLGMNSLVVLPISQAQVRLFAYQRPTEL
ncbi:hypothetical protein EDB86DRAFT_2809465 [Lactarius hatsudake]|nr:hypothetical protein EDB86DRAFT_2809465 [Lactarius hatsudake]